MAARRGIAIALTLEHQRRVRDGEISLAGLADELATSRQSLHEAFRRRGWATKAMPAEHRLEVDDYGPGDLERRGVGHRSGAPTSAARRRSPPAAPSPSPASTSVALGVVSAPATIDLGPPSHSELRLALQQETANVAILAIMNARDIMAKQIGAAGLRQAIASVGLALDVLDRVGFNVADDPSAVVPVMAIMEYTAAELAAIQAQAEREHQGLHPANDDD